MTVCKPLLSRHQKRLEAGVVMDIQVCGRSLCFVVKTEWLLLWTS